MNSPEVAPRIRAMLCQRLGLPADRVPLEARLSEDLGMDSLDAVQLVISIEKEFDLEVSDSDVQKLGTVHDLVGLVQRMIDERGGG